MGKGKRGREERKRRSELTEELIERLHSLETPSAVQRLLRSEPALTDGVAGEQLRALASQPGWSAFFVACVELIDGASDDVQSAWDRFEVARAKIEVAAERAASATYEIDVALERGRWSDAVAMAEAGIEDAASAGLGLAVGHLQGLRAQALTYDFSASRSTSLEKALQAYETALDATEPGPRRVELAMQLALVYSERVVGDRAQNHNVAITLLGDALESLPAGLEPDLEAMAQTNLATLLVRSEGHERRAVLEAAARLCRTALQHRSPERDATDWLYSQINLGEALEGLAELDDADPSEAITTFSGVIDAKETIGEEWLVGAGHHALGRLYLRQAQRIERRFTGMDMVDADGHLRHQEDGLEETQAELLRQATSHLADAVSLSQHNPDRLRIGHVLNDLADALLLFNDERAAVETGRQALRVLHPTTSPSACRRAGWRQGNLLAENGRWSEAAEAFGVAVVAADLVFYSRIKTASRDADIQESGNLYRWAAFATAAAGDAAGAALILENGRARELRRRLGPRAHASEADLVPEALQHQLATAINDLAAARLDESSEDAATRLQETLASVRSLPGLERFAMGSTTESLGGAVEQDWPVVFVDPTPFGTLLVSVHDAGDSFVVDAQCLNTPTALDIFAQLLAGVDANELGEDRDDASQASYLLGVSSDDPNRDLGPDVELPLPGLGAQVAKPIMELCRALGATGLTLIPCGPIACAPLHAATWEEDGRSRCLVDELEIRFAPSVAVAAATLRRSEEVSEDERLLILANPEPESNNALPAAEAEALEIVALFGEASVQAAFGPFATKAFLEDHARSADRLHFACHASGSLIENQAATIYLADGPLPGSALTELYPLVARSVVVSACQSGVTEMNRADEPLSIGTTFLAAGAACSIVSLWAVDDLATAMLMVRFYEEAISGGRRPPEALRRAQLWMRQLGEHDELRFVERHPDLLAEYRRRAAQRGLPGDRSRMDGDHNAGRIYAHPQYWAAFTAVGA